MLVCGVLLATPNAIYSPGLPLALLAWSITEIIRYGFYGFNLLGVVPKVLIFLRYLKSLIVILLTIKIVWQGAQFTNTFFQIHHVHHIISNWCHRGAALPLLGSEIRRTESNLERRATKYLQLYIFILLFPLDRDASIHSAVPTALFAHVHTQKEGVR